MRGEGKAVSRIKGGSVLIDALEKIAGRKLMYTMQVLKQFILFPSDSDSSVRSVSKYDRLIFSDEELHTVCKKI